jgi:hypothetical protein
VNLTALLEEWAAKYEVETVLERAVGPGAAPACARLAAQGKHVVAVVDDASGVQGMRGAYGPATDVRTAGAGGELPKSDLVVVHGERLAGDWRASLVELGALTSKILVLAVDNPRAWPVRARSLAARFGGANGSAGADGVWGRTEALAPVLWAIGRVREHAYLETPPLGVRVPKLASRVAPLHAFVVDVTPRTPQARRKLRLRTA